VVAETYETLIETLVEQRACGLALNQSEAFLDVVTELILQDHDLSIDEIDAGITDGSGDGQIDAMYVLVNGAGLVGSASGQRVADVQCHTFLHHRPERRRGIEIQATTANRPT
jgi:hypothetical protein